MPIFTGPAEGRDAASWFKAGGNVICALLLCCAVWYWIRHHTHWLKKDARRVYGQGCSSKDRARFIEEEDYPYRFRD